MKKIVYIYFLFLTCTYIGFTQDNEADIFYLPFNSAYNNEFAPVMYNNGLLFCSDNDNNYLVKYATPSNKKLFDIYYVERTDSNAWNKPERFSEIINTNFHEGPLTFDKKSGAIYFTRNIYHKKKLGNSIKKENKLGIFYTQCNGLKCQGIRPFIHNSIEYNIAHPAISPDGNTLFFSCDKDGGYGGMDIYYSRKENRRWSEPVNLGPEVNTDRDEVYPFYHPNGRLYFSSDGHDGIRKLDIFFTTKINKTWSKPVLLNKPINSWADDFGYISDKNNTKGYFSSGRKKNDDIYFFTYNLPSFPDCDSIRETKYCITVFEKGSMNLDTTTYKYQWDFGDGTKVRDLEASHCYSDTGTYLIKLNVIDTLTNQVYYNEATYEFELKEIEQVYITAPDTCYVNQEIKLSSNKTHLPNYIIDDYYWKFDNGEISTSSSTKHTFYSPGNKKVKLGLLGKYKNGKEEKKECGYKNIIVLPKNK